MTTNTDQQVAQSETLEQIAQCERLVPCRYCGAPKGTPCDQMYKGRQGSKDRPHSIRRLDAIREGR